MELEKIYSPIKKELGRIETELRSQLLSSKDEFILEVNRYLLDSAGKRLRPSLVLPLFSCTILPHEPATTIAGRVKPWNCCR